MHDEIRGNAFSDKFALALACLPFALKFVFVYVCTSSVSSYQMESHFTVVILLFYLCALYLINERSFFIRFFVIRSHSYTVSLQIGAT